MPYHEDIEQPNTKTWEKVNPFFLGDLERVIDPTGIGVPIYGGLGDTLARNYELKRYLGWWLIDQAIESLTESPYTNINTDVYSEAIRIGTVMGFIGFTKNDENQ